MMKMNAMKRGMMGSLRSIGGRTLVILWFLLVVTSAVINITLAQTHSGEVAKAQARTMFEHIVLTRSWNARHGGVYVPITDTTRPNPYLKVPERDVITELGTKLTKINPAYMTRQVSELAQQSEGVQFHITSLNPLRPKNAPTPWERAALERFELGEKETGQFLHDEHQYRYMAPLTTTKGCLKCHEEQGYKLGDIRGGISVTQSVEEILHNREHTIVNTLAVHILVFIMSILAFKSYTQSQRRLQSLTVDKESAEQANAFKGAFIANISHELRTPLNAIIGMSHILNGEALKPTHREHVRMISEAGRRLNTMINHMLDFSQIDSGTLELKLAPLQLRQVVQDSVDLMQEKAKKKGLSLSVELPARLPDWLQGDAQHIQQLLIHILDNAIKFTESGEVKVIVGVGTEENMDYAVAIVIEDSGIGMEKAPQWLEQHDFSQIEDSHTRHKGGVGLGLTLSRRLLELMGGSLHIKSEVGRGTQVTINLVLKGTERPGRMTESDDIREAVKTQNRVPDIEETIKVGPITLTEKQRQRLDEQLSQLVTAIDSDMSHAMEIVAEMIEAYEGSEYQTDLESLSDNMASFDSDSVIKLSRSIQKRLLEYK